jgi:hypothetical protein
MDDLPLKVLNEEGEVIAAFKHPTDRDGFEGFLQEYHDDFDYDTRDDD